MNFPFGDRCRGAARLSSARVVRCWVKSRNERNPRPVLLILRNALSGDRQRQAGGRWGRRQVIVAFMSRATHVLQWPVQSAANPWGRANRKKTGPSSDCRLQPACMKLESLVMAYQNDAVNTFPGLVHTARHITKVDCTRSLHANFTEAAAQGVIHDWGEVVTR